MNLEDLKQTLASMADDVRAQDPAARLAGVDEKLKAARRRRTTGAGIGVAAAAAVLSLVLPNVFSTAPNRPTPAARTDFATNQHPPPQTTDGMVDTTLPTVTDKGAVFYRAPAGDTLIGESVGSPGQTSVALTVTPKTRDLSFVQFCWQRRPRSATPVSFDARVNGRAYVSSECGSDRHGPLEPEIRFSRDRTVNSSQWRNLGVTPGRAMTVRLTVPPRFRELARTEKVQLGLAIYANTGPTVMDRGITIPTRAVFVGRAYELVARAFRHFRRSPAHIKLQLPATQRSLFTVTGVRGLSRPYVVSGADGSLSQSGTGGASQVSGPVAAGQQVARATVHSRRDPSGLLYLLIYQQTR